MTRQTPPENHLCFCELAPLYAIGALDDSDRRWVEIQIADNPELEEELAEYEAAVATLPYSVPPVAIATDLKDRLFQRIGEDITAPIPDSDNHSTAPSPGIVKCFSELRWRAYHSPGLQIASLNIDRSTREMSCLIRAEAGAQYPPHRHGGIEEIMMLEGELILAGETYQKGDYIRSEPDSIHPLASTPQGCIFFLRTSLDTETLASD